MNMKRLFIALPIEAGFSRQLLKNFGTLDLPWEKLKIVDFEQLHLTLKFLGDTPLDKLPEIIKALNEIKIGTKDIELNIYQTKIFNPARPQVLSLSIKENLNLQKLYDAIDQKLFDKSLAHKEIRKFTPHLTLARIKKSADLKEFDAFTNWPVNKIFSISYFELIESELTSKGPVYTVLQIFDL